MAVVWILAGIVALIILAVVALQFPGVQRIIAQKALSSISEKTHSRIEVGSVNIGFPNSVVLRNIFVETRQKDTLLSIQGLSVDVSLLRLFSHDIKLNHVRIDSLTTHITRALSDSSFNFDFLLNAISPPSTAPDIHLVSSAGPGWVIHVGTVSLNGLLGTYDDDVSGLNIRVRLGTLDASIDKVNLEQNQYYVDQLTLSNTIATITQTKETPTNESTSAAVDPAIKSLSLMNLHFTYDNTVSGEHYGVDLGTSNLLADKINLPSHHIAVKNLRLENTNVVVIPPKTRENKTEHADASLRVPWVITLDHLILARTGVQYDDQGSARMKGFDPNHLWLDGLTMQAENLYYSEDRISALVRHTAFREHSGVEVRELSGGFTVDSLHARFTDFTVETPASRVHQNSLLSYSSIAALKELSGTVQVKATIDDSHLAISDLLFFQPSLPVRNTPGASIRFSSELSGRIGDLQVEEFKAAVGDSTTIDLTGSISGLPEIETAHYDVSLRLLTSARNDIRLLVADTLLPANIVLPATMSMSGSFKGTAKNFYAASDITTSMGNIQGNATMASGQGPGSSNSRWDIAATVDEFDLGSFLNDPETFGAVSLKAAASGTGLSRDNVEAQVDVHVEKASVNGYEYQGLSLIGTAHPNLFEGKAEILDSNIAFTLKGSVNTSDKIPKYKFTLDLKGADLHRLNFTSDDIRVAGTATADVAGNTINDLHGTVDTRNVVIIKNGKLYAIDSLVCVAANNKDQTHISVESSILAGAYDGSVALGDLPDELKRFVDHYFTLAGADRKENLKAGAFSFHISLRDPATLTEIFLPDFHHLSAGTIKGSYESEKKTLSVMIDIPRIDYGDFRIDSLALAVTSDSDFLQATLKAGSIADSTFRLTNLQLAAKAAHDSIDIAVKSIRSDGSRNILLAGGLRSNPDGYVWRFRKDGVVFNNLPWEVPADNYLAFGKNRFVAHNIVLHGADQTLSLKSTDEQNQRSPLKIEFTNFDLATLSHFVERQSGLLGGILNGNIVLQNLEKKRAFTSDLTVKGFSFEHRLVGDLALKASNQTENTYDVTMDVTGNGNQIAMKGTYRSVEGGNALDLSFDFKTVNLASVEPFTFGNVERLSGTMAGGLHVTGTLKKPSVSGDLNFTNTSFNPKYLDTYLHLKEGKIAIDAQGIEFRSFELTDTLGNKASLSGRVVTEDFRSFSFDVKAHTEKFLALNKPVYRDALYYGTVILNSDVFVRGNDSKPIITLQAELDKGTNLAFVLPESELAVEERSGIVRFVDLSAPSNSIMSRQHSGAEGDTTEAKPSSTELTANISVNKDARLRLLIDPIAGDSLVIQGEATLSLTIDPSGKLTLTGRYDISKGSYQLSFGDVVRKDFAITEGSSLTWLGSPLEADVDITAMYTIKASALELVQDQLAGITQEERNKFKQELPIQVYLMMKGKLLKPDIHFRLDLPPDKRGVMSGTVYAKLNELNSQESELNKQVFALLILGRFVPENPLASSSGNVVLSDFARSSVSQILSAQLNRLSEQYIAGASLNVGLESYQDYSTGTAEGRTQLKLALSKQFFDERVTVQVGGNVDLEGRRSQENSLNNFAGDLKVLYKLTEDGRWQLQVFRQNSYEGAIDGDIIKTGVGVMFTIDFDKLFGITLKPVTDKQGK